MNDIYFVDIHTHSCNIDEEVIAVRNIGQELEFTNSSGSNFFSAGLHPWHLKLPEENNVLLSLVREKTKIDRVFVGETGLDKRCTTDFEEQKRIFEAQAIIAEKNNRPIIIHCIRAYNEVLAIYKKLNPKMTWIFHAYNGSIEMTRQLAAENFMFSFGEYLFLPGIKAIESFKYLPLNKIFFETDESRESVKQMYKQGALLKKISNNEFKKAVWHNFSQIVNKFITDF
ncbi:MAG: TatD family hydrolase [Bacteroidales bacterium]|jgi:TatD DNase family protein|nr:TatD family hydrolase [Bacteroidales bacterium]